MSATVLEAPPSPRFVPAHPCIECGYDLRGLPARHPCPECGQINEVGLNSPAAASAWSRCVACGLFLLLLPTVQAIASVLIQPFGAESWGTLPALNFPGPKLWVMPLLQRPIGNTPELPGVMGTRAALLSLLAIWLITRQPDGGDATDFDRTLRLATRITAIVTFGAAFGILLASQGFWPNDLPPYRLMLVSFGEFPTTTLLYAYLRRLAGNVPGRDRRDVFIQLQWIVPMTIGAAIGLMLAGWLLGDVTIHDRFTSLLLPMSMMYGVMTAGAGVIAISAVGGLAFAFAGVAFPDLWRIASGIRRFGASLWRGMARTEPQMLARLAPALGLALLCIVTLQANETLLWYTTRRGLAANLPFFNFHGPKFWQ